MPRTLPLVLVAALVLPAALAGCAGNEGGPGNKVSRSISLPRNGSAEANLRMDAGASIHFSWETEPPSNLTFDLHAHVNGSVEVHRNATATEGEGSFQAPRNGTFSLLWRDPELPVRLVATVEGNFTLASFPVR